MFLIIGSQGFVGQALIQQFRSQSLPFIDVDCAGNPSYKIDIVSDFSKLDSLISEYNPSYVINLAAFSNSKSCNLFPEKVYALNVDFVRRLALSCIKYCVPSLFHASSEWIYGPGPVMEMSAINPMDCYHRSLDLYSRSKLDSELILHHIIQQKPSCLTKFVIYRFGIIYGNSKFQSNCVVDYLLSSFKSSNELSVNSPHSSRCFVALDDICDLFTLAPAICASKLSSPLNTFNIQGPSSYSLSGIIDFLYNKSSFVEPSLANTQYDTKVVASDLEYLLDRSPTPLESYLKA